MNAFFGLLFAFLVAGSNGLPSAKIVGGTDAELGKYPYMTSLRYENNHFCGGSIIAKRYILTAAHCIKEYTNHIKDLKKLTVHVGTNFVNETGYVYTVEKAIVHNYYNNLSIRNDIGLLRLSSDIVYNKVVQPITVAPVDSTLPEDYCFLTGWGIIELFGKESVKLQKLDMKVYSYVKCKLNFLNIQKSHICAFSKYGQGACYGDSGSPLVAHGMQIGIASFVRPCAIGVPDVYTRVYSFKTWLTQNMVN